MNANFVQMFILSALNIKFLLSLQSYIPKLGCILYKIFKFSKILNECIARSLCNKKSPSETNNYITHQQSSRLAKSASNMNSHAPINSQIIVPYGTNFIEESSQDQMHKDGTTESDESDAGLDDFFPQADPLSGLTFVNKNIIVRRKYLNANCLSE